MSEKGQSDEIIRLRYRLWALERGFRREMEELIAAAAKKSVDLMARQRPDWNSRKKGSP